MSAKQRKVQDKGAHRAEHIEEEVPSLGRYGKGNKPAPPKKMEPIKKQRKQKRKGV